jgi:hypothetical protein
MSLVLTGPDNQFKFSRSPIGLLLTTTDRITTAGVKYSRTITFINYPTADGVTFSITWGTTTVTMTSMASPITEDGLHYRKRTGAETLAVWIAHFAADIATNYYIGKYFDITYTTTTVTITAKYAGVAYNLSAIDMPGTVVTDYTLGSETLGVDEVVAINYRVLVDICFDTDDFITTEMYLTDELPYDDVTGVYEQQIQKILHRRLKSTFPLTTEIGTILFPDMGSIILKYWLRYYAVTGATPIPGHYYLDDNSGEYYYAVMGGHYRNRAQLFLQNYSGSIQFLTWQNRTKYVTMDQPEFLYWFVPNSNCYFGKLRLVITYTDDTTTTQDFEWEVDKFIAMYMPVGYKQLVTYFIEDAKTVKKWTIEIVPTDEVEPFTSGETFTFYPVVDETPWLKYFVFRNSFGAYDTLRSRGVAETGLDITGEVLNKWLDASYLEPDGQYLNSEFENRVTHKAAIGFMEQEEMIDYLREIFVSPNMALLTYNEDTDDGSYIAVPMVIDPSSIKIKKDDDMLFTFEFNYSEAFNDTGIFELIP